MLQFVREIPIRIEIQKALSERRGFLFHVAVGFHAPVDPLTGMAVNLVVVDEWLAALKVHLEGKVFSSSEDFVLNGLFAEVLRETRVFLQNVVRAKKSSVKVGDIDFREERHFGFRSEMSAPTDIDFYHHHYLEILEDKAVELRKLTFFWRHMKGCVVDYQQSGADLAKRLLEKSSDDLPARLNGLRWHRLQTGTFLNRIVLEDPLRQSKIRF